MRYDTELFLQAVTRGEYNASTGDYGDDIITETCVRGSVTDTGTDEVKLIYGELVRGAKVVRLCRDFPLDGKYSNLRIGDRVYHIDVVKNFTPKATLYISEAN